MKTSGILRRLDSLGRIVIPKEIRTRLNILEGDRIEIFAGDEEIVLRKHSVLGNFGKTVKKYAEVLGIYTGHAVIITDRECVISTYSMPGCEGMELDGQFVSRLEERKPFRTEVDKMLVGANGMERKEYAVPILCESDIIGAVVLVAKGAGSVIRQTDESAAGYAAVLLGMQPE